MSKRYCLALFFLLVLHCFGNVRVVCTAALTDAYFEFRKQQYIESFGILNNYGINDLYIIEALKKSGPTFLEEYSSNVFYATVNNIRFINNGANEAATFREGLEYFKFDDDDMIIKFTGRHQLTSDYLLRLVEDNPDYDAFVRMNSEGHVYALCFAMRFKYLKEMYDYIDFNDIGLSNRPIEHDMGSFIKLKLKDNRFKIFYFQRFYIKANIFGSTITPCFVDRIQYY